MRKILAILFAMLGTLIMLFENAAFAENTAETAELKTAQTEEPVDLGDIRVGGWAVNEDTAITDADLARFAQAMEGLVGVDYTPVLCLGHQLVAGMNYCYLCRAQVVYPNAEPYYALVYIYEDLKGIATVLDIQTLELGIS